VAIITKTIDEANLICQSFKKNFDIISVIDINTETFKTDLVVAPAYGVKGLEFDACLIVNNFDSDPYLYYVAVTRAQHELIVYE
jgi:DNA helicase IV